MAAAENLITLMVIMHNMADALALRYRTLTMGEGNIILDLQGNSVPG